MPRFQAAWDGHAFVSERGTQFRCCRGQGQGVQNDAGMCRALGTVFQPVSYPQPSMLLAQDGPGVVASSCRCQVEYAPFQKVPRQRVKRDPKEGTIERGELLYRHYSLQWAGRVGRSSLPRQASGKPCAGAPMEASVRRVRPERQQPTLRCTCRL